MLIHEDYSPASPEERARAITLEVLNLGLEKRIPALCEEGAEALKRVQYYVVLVRKSVACYDDVIHLVAEDEIALIKKLGYEFKLSEDGLVSYCEDPNSSKPLTEAEYFKVMDQLKEQYQKEGISEKLKSAYNKAIDAINTLDIEEPNLNFALINARNYLDSVEGMLLITQWHSTIYLLHSLKNMFANS